MDYEYLPVRDAISAVNQKVNIAGVIVEYGLEKCRGPDWFCTLMITDESYQGYSLSVSVFAESADLLPHVKSAGDIICFTRVKMKSHHGTVKAIFNKELSAFALFEGKFAKSFIPYQASLSYRPRHSDPDFLTSLRTWLLNWQFDSGASESIVPLENIRAGKWFDLVCKIIKVREVSKDAWVLYLWDGTDAPPLSCCTNLNDEIDNPVPLSLEMSALPRDVLCEFPNVGTVLRVILNQNTKDLAIRLPCTWVKFIDVVCEERFGLWCGIFTSSTRARILSDEDLIVKQRKRLYKRRLRDNCCCMPFLSLACPPLITETSHKSVPLITLMSVLNHSEVRAKFRCVVRVVAICPARVEDMYSPLEQGLYRIRLTLEDPTARIHAYIYAEDGEKFFGGHPTVDVLTHKVKKLLGITEEDGMQGTDAPRYPPWIRVCLKSYYLEKDNPWETRNFRIFDTILMG